MRDYLKRNRVLWMVFVMLTALVHGTMLFSTSIGIDTEVMMGLQDSFYESWLGIGRYGLVWIKTWMDTKLLNPVLIGILTTVIFPCVCLSWTFYFEKITGKENTVATVFFGLILITYTIMTEQLYFKLQAVEVLLALMFTGISLFLVYDAALHSCGKERIVKYVIAVLLNILDFGVYQVMVPLFIFGAAAGFFLLIYVKRERAEKDIFVLILSYLAVFFGSLLSNQLLAKVFFSNGADYLGNQIAWGKMPFGECVAIIMNHVTEIAFGTQIYYVKTFSIYGVVLLVTCMVLWIQNKGRKGNILGFLSLLLVFLAPFYMTLLCGQTPVIRSQLVMPFVVGFFAYVLFQIKIEKKWYVYLIVVISVFTVYLQLKYTAMLHYSDQVRYESDVRIATRIADRIDALEDDEKTYPVVFFGAHEAELNPSCIKGDVIGYSFFEWDADTEPFGVQGTRRILCFMQSLGMNYGQATAEQTKKALEASRDMPVWPAQKSVQKINDVIIIKLGTTAW